MGQTYKISAGAKKKPYQKLPISNNFKLRNKTFVCIGRVRNVRKLNVFKSGAKTSKIMIYNNKNNGNLTNQLKVRRN